MAEDLLEPLEALERQGWDSLCDGTGSDFYGERMTPDGRMVLAHGQALDRDQVVASLRDAPPWDGYTLEDLSVVTVGVGAAALVYRATARRADAPDFVAWMSSVYVQDGDSWRLALYTQTPVPAG